MTTAAAASKDQAPAVSTSTLHAFLSLARRRAVIIAVCAVLAADVALLLAVSQQPLYQASARVLLTYENFAAALTSTPDASGVLQQPERIAQTQVSLARLPTLANRTLRAAGLPRNSASDFLAASSVSVEPNADLLTFRVRDADPGLAARLATEYGRQFTAYRRTLDTAALRQARTEVEASLTRLRAAGDDRGALYAELVEREKQLRTLESLQTSSAYLVDPATRGVQVEPRPVRNAVLGFLLGLIVGFGLAYLWDRLDTRVRSGDEMEAHLQLPLLGSVATQARQPARSLAMLAEGDGAAAEGYRVLRNSIELASLDRHVRVLMITSAVAGEGKSTTAANLAIAFARAGKRVVLVDLDLRDPDQHRFFDVAGRPGLTDVILGKATMDEALATIAVTDHEASPVAWERNGGGTVGGVLDVVTMGPLPPDPGEFVGGQALGRALDELRARSDLVLLDCSPLLGVGDAVVLSLKSDAMIVVTRLGVTRTPMLREVRRVLEACRAYKLGFVLVGARLDKHVYRPRKQPRRAAASRSAKKALRPIRRS
jgi:polysaccharide biosynthesis transport protein